jgi:hypothetical protein
LPERDAACLGVGLRYQALGQALSPRLSNPLSEQRARANDAVGPARPHPAAASDGSADPLEITAVYFVKLPDASIPTSRGDDCNLFSGQVADQGIQLQNEAAAGVEGGNVADPSFDSRDKSLSATRKLTA